MSEPASFGPFLQSVAEAHLERCFEAQDALEQGEDDVEDPAYDAFCGCVRCVVREVLYVSYGLIEAHVALQLQSKPETGPDLPEQ